MKKLLGLFVVLFMIGCQPLPPEKQQHSEKIYLRQLVNRDVTETNSYGSYFLIAGSYRSQTTTETVIKLMGNVKGEYRFIQFDFVLARIKIDNSVKTPYIVLNYTDRDIIETDNLLEYTGYLDSVTIVCPEQYLPEKLLPIEL